MVIKNIIEIFYFNGDNNNNNNDSNSVCNMGGGIKVIVIGIHVDWE